MQRKPKAPEGGADWMGTYGDMVTLLLCFFVLLYSISSVDQEKWANLVRSLNPDAEDPAQIVSPDVPDEGENPVPGQTTNINDEKFEDLLENLVDFAAEYQGTHDIQVASGDGYSFITFRDSIFFAGDSDVLLPEGAVVLDGLSELLAPASDAIFEIQVLGHTTQANPNIPNDIYVDRVLSASRSAVVTAYIQEKNVVAGEKFISLGFGQFRPIASFDTAEETAQNRRVEILITKNDAVEKSLEEYYDEVYGETGDGTSGDALDGDDTADSAEDASDADTEADDGTGTDDATTEDN